MRGSYFSLTIWQFINAPADEFKVRPNVKPGAQWFRFPVRYDRRPELGGDK